MRMFLAMTTLLTLLSFGSEVQAGDKKWTKKHLGDLQFVIGYEKGLAEAQFSGRPMMLFFTATW